MGVPKLSSGTAYLLLWLFVVRSVQVCVLANALKGNPKADKSEASESTTSLGIAVTKHDAKSAPNRIAADLAGSKADEQIKSVPDTEKVVYIEKNVKLKDSLDKENAAPTSLVTEKLQLLPLTTHSQMEQQHKNDDRPSVLDSSKKLSNGTGTAVVSMNQSYVDKNDVGKGPAPKNKVDVQTTVNGLQKSEDNKSPGKKHVQNIGAPGGGNKPTVNPKTPPSFVKEATTETTLKVAPPGPTDTDGTKALPGQPPQGLQKYTGVSPDLSKDLGAMPPASSSGNLDYGHVREPDSEEELEPPLPTQKGLASAASGSAPLGAQPIGGSVGGSRPEKPLDASAAAGTMLFLPAQDDSHFFAYFLTAVVLCVVGYLAFHNKRKILALILEGRHERQRRHNGHYRRLDNADEAPSGRKSRGSF
ncbi:uncharacterized protein LOC142587002 isoform X1 [Dermacentor variabilis]|uniref:uncharacterized protein LOC142587002 isoform X1 n=1 Tax=Dermacentor variabilis TaxID=34621 RepID=UPI003F5B0DB5